MTQLIVIDLETLPTDLREGEEQEWAVKYAPKPPKGLSLVSDPLNPTEQEMEEWEEMYYIPHKGLKDEEKIEAHKFSKWEAFLEEISGYREKYDDALEEYKLHKRPFKLGGSRVIATGLATINPYEGRVENIQSLFSEIELDHANFICNYVRDRGKVVWVGYNINNFDLPLLALLFNSCKQELPPQAKIGKWDAMDLMQHPLKYQGGCKKMCDIFGIKQGNPEIDGSKVRDLYLQGDIESIKQYVADDVRIEGELAVALNRVYALF